MARRSLVSMGNYKLEPVNLGKGTFATVELATHVVLQQRVALKIVVKSQIRDPYLKKNLHREAGILSRLRHPNIVKLVEVCNSTDIFCLALEYISGGTLFDYMQKRGPLFEKYAKVVTKQIVSALVYLHGKRLLHRDLKLENILLDGERVVLVDFGLSNQWHPGKLMNTFCGSAEYAAPELFWKENLYGPGIDVWSLGVVLYTIVLGHLPFQMENKGDGRSPMDVLKTNITRGLTMCHQKEMNRLSIDCRVLLVNCLNINPTKRITMKSVAKDPWLQGGCCSHEDTIDQLSIATEMQKRLNCPKSPEEILAHMERRKYGTTGGCFHLIELEMLSKARLECTGTSVFSDAANQQLPDVVVFAGNKENHTTASKQITDSQGEMSRQISAKQDDCVKSDTCLRRIENLKLPRAKAAGMKKSCPVEENKPRSRGLAELAFPAANARVFYPDKRNGSVPVERPAEVRKKKFYYLR